MGCGSCLHTEYKTLEYIDTKQGIPNYTNFNVNELKGFLLMKSSDKKHILKEDYKDKILPELLDSGRGNQSYEFQKTFLSFSLSWDGQARCAIDYVLFVLFPYLSQANIKEPHKEFFYLIKNLSGNPDRLEFSQFEHYILAILRVYLINYTESVATLINPVEVVSNQVNRLRETLSVETSQLYWNHLVDINKLNREANSDDEYLTFLNSNNQLLNYKLLRDAVFVMFR